MKIQILAGSVLVLLSFSIIFSRPQQTSNLLNQRTNTGQSTRLNITIPDFQVNETTGPNGGGQDLPAIAADENGNFVVVWRDYRNGDSDVYAQRYSNNGTPIENNFKIHNDAGNTDQHSPAISTDIGGNFVIAWADNRDGDENIYAQRYSSDGTMLGANFKINDDAGNRTQTAPSISADSTGNFVVAWRDDRNGDPDIYAQRFLSDGTPLGNNFKASDDGENTVQFFPSVSVGSGSFVITWWDFRNVNSDIYAQRFASDGTPIGNNFKVNDDIGVASQSYPETSMENSGNFVITWKDNRSSGNGIYAQRYSSDGTVLGSNFKVDDEQGTSPVSISMDEEGDFVITWVDSRNGDLDIYAQRYSSDGNSLGLNFKINDDQGGTSQRGPSISVDASGNFIVVWEDLRSGDFDIYARQFSNNGTELGSSFKINDDQASAPQLSPSISTDSTGNFVVTWSDVRNGASEIFGQRFSNDGTALGNNFKVDDDSGLKGRPIISSDKSGNFVITWRDFRSGIHDIYAQRFSNDGSLLGNNFKVNETGTFQDWSAIACDINGNFIIVWQRALNGRAIYAQRYASDGTLLGNNFMVDDDPNVTFPTRPAIAIDYNGNFTITWKDDQNDDDNIYARRFANDGSPLGSDFKVSDGKASVFHDDPSISADSSGDFVIAWRDFRNSDHDIYAQRYSKEGSALGSNFRVNDDQGSESQENPSVAMDEIGNFVIVWSDNRTGDSNIYAQRYSIDGSLIEGNFRVANTSESQQSSPDVKLRNNRVYTAWHDNRVGGTGYDIWANVLDLSTSVPVELEGELPQVFQLFQNFPNPFNPSTTISYELPQAENVRVIIYDLTGREVRELFNQNQKAGSYSISWDGTNQLGKTVATGVYIYQIRTGEFTQTQKMIFTK